MQQAIYSNISQNITIKTAPATRRAELGRWIAQKWDLVGVLALMASSAAYGMYALASTL